MPADTDLAFVLVQHLAPDHRSLLAELLGRVTRIPVIEAVDGARVVSGHVYVIPPNATLTIRARVLKVCRPAPPREHRRPINAFFSSLAEDQGDCAVCEVLAGTGSDGSEGLRAVKEHGGLALAQSGLDDEAMSGMPASAVVTGLVDAVLPVSEMPARLLTSEKQMRAAHGRHGDDGVRDDVAEHLKTICELVRAVPWARLQPVQGKNPDGAYPAAHAGGAGGNRSGLRRLPAPARQRTRAAVSRVSDRGYRILPRPGRLRSSAHHCRPLNAGRQRLRRRTLRVWVVGCATGEEAYSVAITLREVMADARGPKVKIFATDINDVAISRARAGRYHAPLTGISPERLERWFHKDRDDHRVVKSIRDMCILSPHSVIKDPPFSRMDLVSCRNLMIYLNGELQERLVRAFHYALRPGGFLLLGPSQRLCQNVHLFNDIDKKQRLYIRRDDVGTSL